MKRFGLGLFAGLALASCGESAEVVEEDNEDAIQEVIDDYNVTKRVISDGCTCSSEQSRFHGAIYMLGLLGLFGMIRRRK